jgi:hypothetical protein
MEYRIVRNVTLVNGLDSFAEVRERRSWGREAMAFGGWLNVISSYGNIEKHENPRTIERIENSCVCRGRSDICEK